MQTMQWKDLKSMTARELTDAVVELGEKKFRAGQIYGWLHKKLVRDVGKISNVSPAFLERLTKQYPLYGVSQAACLASKLDGTRKYLFELHDGNVIESVLMRYRHGNSVCISSQAGCRMGCTFCASTLLGLTRNLYPSEMLDQIYAISRITGEKVGRVVVMGSGEPLDNYDNLLRFIDLLTNEDGLNLGQRNLTVSTCGIVPNILKLADKNLSINLALSLHAPNDRVREGLQGTDGEVFREVILLHQRHKERNIMEKRTEKTAEEKQPAEVWGHLPELL